MDNFNNFKKAYYRKKVCVSTEGGVIFFDPDSIKDVVGAERMEYDEYLDVQIASLGKTRSYFITCYLNISGEFVGQVERVTKDHICFKRIYISGMFTDGVMFDGKEEHVWMKKDGFENLKVGDCVQFGAEVYRYLKTGNGKLIDYSLRNPKGVKMIPSYELPSDEELMMQEIELIICETCYLNEQCSRMYCMRPHKEIQQLKNQMLKAMQIDKTENRF
jgi:hypothetical protein